MLRTCVCFLLLTAAPGMAFADSGDVPDTLPDDDMPALHAHPDDIPDTLPDDDMPALHAHPDDIPDMLPDDSQSHRAATDSTPLPIRFEATLTGAAAFPNAGEGGNTSLGFGVTYGIGWGSIPLYIGLDFMSAGSNGSTNFRASAADGGALQVQTSSDNRTLYFDLWTRLQPPHWPVRPYVEGFIGTKVAQTRYSLFPAGGSAGDSQYTSHWSKSYGLGAGLDFAGLLHVADAVSITLGVRLLQGAHWSFPATTTIASQTVSTRLEVASSVTILMLGIVAWFDLAAPATDPGLEHETR
jgi:hypothetical protein